MSYQLKLQMDNSLGRVAAGIFEQLTEAKSEAERIVRVGHWLHREDEEVFLNPSFIRYVAIKEVQEENNDKHI